MCTHHMGSLRGDASCRAIVKCLVIYIPATRTKNNFSLCYDRVDDALFASQYGWYSNVRKVESVLVFV